MPRTKSPAAPQETSSPDDAATSVRLRLRVTVGERIAIGPGKIALLEALRETGSISAAARALDMSYRRAWNLIDELNAALREPAVVSATGGQHGGGSMLTPSGEELITLYRGIENEALRQCRGDIRKLLNRLAP